MLQLEGKTEFREFLEVHKSKTNKSAWGNDTVLPELERLQHTKKKKDGKTGEGSEVVGPDADGESSAKNTERKKKLSDLEASHGFSAIGYQWF